MVNKISVSNNYFIMSEDFNEQDRSGDNVLNSKDLESSTAKKEVYVSSRFNQDLKKSHIQQEKNPDDEALDRYEQRIREIEDKLKEVHLDTVKVGNRDFNRRRELEALRRDLRKELIDVAHSHKQILIDKEEREYERVKEEEEEKIRRLEEDVRKLRESRREKQEKKEQQQKEKISQQKDKEGAENLSQSRRKARIVQLEAELTGEDLRNSRRALIDYELAALKLSYYPYRSYSSLYAPSYRYSYLSPYAYSYYI